VRFTTLLVIAIPAGAWLGTLIAPGAGAFRAIWISAAVAIVVQAVGFALALKMAPVNVFMGWGAAVALRVLALVAYALFGVKFGGLPAAPALISLVVFFFVTTLVEPVMLKR
jgi:hypothetical protein